MVSKRVWRCHFMLMEHRIQADFTDRPFSVKGCGRTGVQSVIQLRTKIYGTVLIENVFVYKCVLRNSIDYGKITRE